MKRLTIAVNSRTGFTPDEMAEHQNACMYAEMVINSKEFYDAFRNLKLTNTKGMTNWNIYKRFMMGSDELNNEEDYDLDVDVEIYYKNNSTVGYTKPGTIKTWINRKFFKQYTAAEIAGNLIHEYFHKCGFDHNSAKEWTSVPYAAGYLARDLVITVLNGRILTPMTALPNGEEPPSVVIVPKKMVCSRSWKTLFRKVCHYE